MPSPETPQVPQPTEQANRQQQSPEARNNVQPQTLQQRTDTTLGRMTDSLGKIAKAFEDFSRQANIPGTPENKIREAFKKFMGAMSGSPDRNQAFKGIVDGPARQWLESKQMTVDSARALISATDPTVANTAGTNCSLDVVGNQLRMRIFTLTGGAREFTIDNDRRVTNTRNYETKPISSLLGQTAQDGAVDLQIDMSDTQLTGLINEARQAGVQFRFNPPYSLEIMARGQIIDRVRSNFDDTTANLRTALRTGIERMRASPAPAVAGQNPNQPSTRPAESAR